VPHGGKHAAGYNAECSEPAAHTLEFCSLGRHMASHDVCIPVASRLMPCSTLSVRWSAVLLFVHRDSNEAHEVARVHNVALA
jgi:hypothetical protein